MENIVNGLSLGTSLNALDPDSNPEPVTIPEATEKRFSNENIVGIGIDDSINADVGQEHYKGFTAHQGDFKKRATAEMQVGEGLNEPELSLPLNNITNSSMNYTGTIEPDEHYEDQFKYDGSCEGIDIQDIDYEEQFLLNLKNQWDQNKEMDVLIPLLTNPEMNVRTFKKTNRGQFELVRSMLKRMLSENLIRFNQGHIEMPGQNKPLNEITKFIDTLGPATLGDNTLTKSGLQKIKKELKELAKEMKKLYDELKKQNKSDTEIDYRITELITRYTNDNTLIEPAQLEVIIRGARLTYGQMTVAPPPAAEAQNEIAQQIQAAAQQVEIETPQEDIQANEVTNPPTINEWYQENGDLIDVLIATGAQNGVPATQITQEIENAYRRATNQQDEIVEALSDEYRQTITQTVIDIGSGLQNQERQVQMPLPANVPLSEPNPVDRLLNEVPQFTGLDATTAAMAAGAQQLQEVGVGIGAAVKGGYDYAAFVYQAIADSIKDKFNQSPSDKKRGPKKGVPRKTSAKFKDGAPLNPDSTAGNAYFKMQHYMAKIGGAGAMNWMLSQITEQQFNDFISQFNLSNKKFTFGLIFALFYFFDGLIIEGGFVSRLTKNLLNLLSNENLSVIGLIMASLLTGQLLGYTNAFSGLGGIASISSSSMEEIRSQLGKWLAVSMKIIFAYGVGYFFEQFIRSADRGTITELADSSVRLVTFSSYAIPIAIILFGAFGGFAGVNFSGTSAAKGSILAGIGSIFGGGGSRRSFRSADL